MKALIQAGILAAATLPALAQKKPAPSPAAPIPPAIAAAKTAFLSNMCEQPFPTCAGLYNTLYAGLQQQGRFQLVPSPAQADLVLEIHYVPRFEDDSTVNGMSRGSINISRIMIQIVDRPTHYVLWSASEPEFMKEDDLDTPTSLLLKDIAMLATTGATATIGPVKKYR